MKYKEKKRDAKIFKPVILENSSMRGNDFLLKISYYLGCQVTPVSEKKIISAGIYEVFPRNKFLATHSGYTQGENPSSRIHKIFLHKQSHTTLEPLDMLLTIKRRQHRIPQLIRQVMKPIGLNLSNGK